MLQAGPEANLKHSNARPPSGLPRPWRPARTQPLRIDTRSAKFSDQWYRCTRLRQRGFASFEEAEGWLIRRLEQLRAEEVHGRRAQRLFSEVAAYYLVQHQDKASIVSETDHLKSVMPTIGHLPIHQVHDGTLAPHVEMRLDAGRSHKTVNLDVNG